MATASKTIPHFAGAQGGHHGLRRRSAMSNVFLNGRYHSVLLLTYHTSSSLDSSKHHLPILSPILARLSYRPAFLISGVHRSIICTRRRLHDTRFRPWGARHLRGRPHVGRVDPSAVDDLGVVPAIYLPTRFLPSRPTHDTRHTTHLLARTSRPDLISPDHAPLPINSYDARPHP